MIFETVDVVKTKENFHYIEWNEEEILSRLRSELKWESPKQFASTWRFDCKVGHVKDLLYIKTLGLTERDDSYSKMVREGILTRDEALARLKKENDRREALLKREEELYARRMLAGKSFAGKSEEKPKPMTDEEYSQALLDGKIPLK
jgi:hypothetical protein